MGGTYHNMTKGVQIGGRSYAWYDSYVDKKRALAQAASMRGSGWLAQVRKVTDRIFVRWAVYYTPVKGWLVDGRRIKTVRSGR